MKLTPLHPLFGVEVHDVDLRTVERQSGYLEIREAFERRIPCCCSAANTFLPVGEDLICVSAGEIDGLGGLRP